MKSRFFFSVLGCLLCLSSAHAQMTYADEKIWVAGFVFADHMQMAAGASATCEPNYTSCAEASIEKIGYVLSDCKSVTNDAQDQCAGVSIQKSGYVFSECLKLDHGGRCAAASIEKGGYVYSECLKITNDRQDRCAAASIKKSGYVFSDCLNL